MNMVKWLKNLFNHKCEHSWRVEDPLIDFGSNFQVWEGPIFERCIKCGERRRRPDCRHMWFLAPDENEINGLFVNGKIIKKTAVCGKCGLSRYEVVED